MPRKRSLAVLISGRGSNMLAIDDACRDGRLHATIDLVISNKTGVDGVTAAERRGLTTVTLDHTRYPDRLAFDNAMDAQLRKVRPDWIILAGFMRILTPDFVQRWPQRILNIHPSLLPLYPGLHTHRQALEAGDTEAGASVHIVTAELDAGPVIAQVRVPVQPDDTEQTLAQRVLSEEHALYIKALQQCLILDTTSESRTVLG